MKPEISCESILSSVLGEELGREECEVLGGVMQVRQYSDGEILVRENQSDCSLFVLIAGGLAVSSGPIGQEETVYHMLAGEVAGTRAFVDRTPRQANLRAVGNALVYALQPADFETLLESHPLVVYKVMRGLFRLTHENLMRMNTESRHLSNYIHKTGGRC